MKAITVKHLPPTDTKPRRIKVQAEGVPHLVFDANSTTPRQGAERLCVKFGWGIDLIEGTLPNGDLVFVFNPHAAALAASDKLANAAFALGHRPSNKGLQDKLAAARQAWDAITIASPK
jgi:hypothetical protein